MEYRFQQLQRKVFDLKWEELKQAIDIVPYEDIQIDESYIIVQKITYKVRPGRPAGVIKQRQGKYYSYKLKTILGSCKVFETNMPLSWKGYSSLYGKSWFVYKK